MQNRLFSVCFSAIVAFAACSATEDRVQRSSHEVVAGSCSLNNCGDKSTGACWCDDLCASYGDCCAYKAAVCDAPPLKQVGEMCGGLKAFQCEPGLVCADDAADNCDPDNGGADCSGICRQMCGGFANFQCPTGLFCVDDPSDDCDNNNGGADCSGICIEQEPCHTSGCSGQVCVRASQNVITTCEYLPAWGCLVNSECGNFGDNGSCAWKQTPAYDECLADLANECSEDADCQDGWCRPTQDGGKACAAWVLEGHTCAGFTPQWMANRCAPNLTCHQTAAGAYDLPGVCVPFCGGIANIQCEVGSCVLDGTYPDAGGHCEGDSACPTTCGEYCPQAGNCTLADGCSNPGCGCLERDCSNFCGGVGALPCEPGNHCVLDGGHPDAGGYCEVNATNSCGEHCGGQSADKSCWCDSLCTYYGDCCSDITEFCPAG